MSDAGEGLVDAEARLQEQLDAREHEKRRRGLAAGVDPEKLRARESLRLARAELTRLTLDDHRYGTAAVAELDRRMAAV